MQITLIPAPALPYLQTPPPNATTVPNLANEGGTGGVVTYDGNPNGVLSATGPALCIGINSSDGKLFKHVDSGASTTWIQI